MTLIIPKIINDIEIVELNIFISPSNNDTKLIDNVNDVNNNK
jgi:hypothetical protein